MFYLNFSNKFESYNLQHCEKNCRKLVFCVFQEQLLPFICFGRLHCSCKKNSETTTTDFIKLFFKVNKKKDRAILGLNNMIVKLKTISKCWQLNCWKTQQLLAIVTLFLTCRGIIAVIIIDHN